MEAFENAGLITDGQVVDQRIRQMSATEIIDFAQQTAELTSIDAIPAARTQFTFSATTTLGGGTSPCSAYGCRLRHVSGLREFAALYSDRVYVHNFLAEHYSHPRELAALGDDQVRARFWNDVSIIRELLPMISAGIVAPVTLTGAICPHCFAESHPESQLAIQIEAVSAKLAEECFATMRVELRDHEHPLLSLSAPGLTIDHPLVRSHGKIQEVIDRLPATKRNRLLRGQHIVLSKEFIKELGAHTFLATEVLRDVRFGLALAATTGSSFLTEHPAHREMLDRLTGEAELQRRNSAVRDHLIAVMPFVADVNAADLVQLRENEAESFLLFRKALVAAIQSVRDSGREFDERSARELYSDVLEPELARLSLKVKAAKRQLRLRPTREAAAWVGAISFGLLSGALGQSVSEMVKQLGLVAAAKVGLSKTLEDADSEAEVLSEPMYFLWKVQQRAKASAERAWGGA
ncbi:hypothetical protein [Gemmatimonas sp.]